MELNALINFGLATAIGGLGWWIKAQHAELGRTLIFIGYGHVFINGYGSWFYKACHYQCDGMYNKRVYRVDPDYYCPRSFREA
jgi:hypothetical protein